MIKRSWIEIDLKTIASNYEICKSIISREQELMAVVKADAYGHGEVEVASKLQEIGCQNFAVSNIKEAVALRKAGIKGQILILGYTPVDAYYDLLKYDITQALLSKEYAEKLKDKGIKAQFAIDTGMNRIGLNADDSDKCEKIIREYLAHFELTGIFTHLCTADTEDGKDFTNAQIEKFEYIVNNLADCKLRYIHCLNSAGGLWHKPYGNLVRLGIVLYGLKPDYSNILPKGIQPALKWKSVVSMIKTVYPGETIGYGRSFKVSELMKVATIPTGYADGYNRLLSNVGRVFINGKSARILGKVCMDQMMVDITEIDASFGDEVILLGDEYNADDMACDIGTIGYEVLCDISKRVDRVYL